MFDTLDYHLTDNEAEPTSADPIQVEVTFSDRSGEEWDDRLVARLNRVRILQVDDEACNHVRLRVTSNYDQVAREFVHSSAFLDLEGNELGRVGRRALTALQDEIRYFYLRALRDAARHFDATGPFWRPFLRDSQLSPDRKAEIEAKLQEVNELVVSSHASFDQVQAGLRQVQSVVPLGAGEAVSIEAVPGRSSTCSQRPRSNSERRQERRFPWAGTVKEPRASRS